MLNLFFSCKTSNETDLLCVAPELLRNTYRETDFRALQCADVYSFGIIVYETLTRKEPFEDEMRTYSIDGTQYNIFCRFNLVALDLKHHPQVLIG